MKQKVFFSWQVDTETNSGRNFIAVALEKVCKNITSNPDLEEATRNLTLDSDTKGAPGQAPIVETIFRKIDSSSVYVADMTFVASRIDGRPSPNPNVLIEYGWALKSLGHEKVITVMNTDYGEPSDQTLPFNMKHVLHPITYHLPKNATVEDKQRIKNQLVKDLERAVNQSLTYTTVTAAEPLPFPEKQPLFGLARFRAEDESIGFNDWPFNKHTEIFLSTGNEMWLRLMPIDNPNRTWSIPELLNVRDNNNPNYLDPITISGGYSHLRADDGVGSYIPNGTNDNIALGVSFAFETGEMWGIDTAFLSYRPNHLFQVEIEQKFVSAIQKYSNFIHELGAGDQYKWIAGINGTKNRKLVFPPKPGYQWIDEGPVCAASQIVAEGKYVRGQSATEALLPFFKKIFEKCGKTRPDYLPQV